MSVRSGRRVLRDVGNEAEPPASPRGLIKMSIASGEVARTPASGQSAQSSPALSPESTDDEVFEKVFAAGPMGIEFEPENVSSPGKEMGCVVARVSFC